jgi:NADH:ubiquinone oxidoreductase subunit K
MVVQNIFPVEFVPVLPSLVILITFSVFLIGLIGLAVVNSNLLIILMSIEIMFFGLGLLVIFLSIFNNQSLGFLIALTMITTSAAETVIGLSLLIRYCLLFDDLIVSNISNPYKSV